MAGETLYDEIIELVSDMDQDEFEGVQQVIQAMARGEAPDWEVEAKAAGVTREQIQAIAELFQDEQMALFVGRGNIQGLAKKVAKAAGSQRGHTFRACMNLLAKSKYTEDQKKRICGRVKAIIRHAGGLTKKGSLKRGFKFEEERFVLTPWRVPRNEVKAEQMPKTLASAGVIDPEFAIRTDDGTVNINAVRYARLNLEKREDLPGKVKEEALNELDAMLDHWRNEYGWGEFFAERANDEIIMSIASTDPNVDIDKTRLKQIALNTGKMLRSGMFRPAVKIGHKDEGPALGHVKDIWYDDKEGVIYASVVPTPKDALGDATPDLKQAILGDGRYNGSYPWRSIETYLYRVPWSKDRVEVIGAVALLGAARPRLKGPAQQTVIQLNQEETTMAKDHQDVKAKEAEAREQSQVKAEHDDILQMQERVQALEKLAEQQKAALEAREKEINQLRQEALSLKASKWRADRVAKGAWIKLFDELQLAEAYQEVERARLVMQEDAPERKLIERLWENIEKLADVATKDAPQAGKAVTVASAEKDQQDVQKMAFEFYQEQKKENPGLTFGDALIEFYRKNPDLDPFGGGKA